MLRSFKLARLLSKRAVSEARKSYSTNASHSGAKSFGALQFAAGALLFGGGIAAGGYFSKKPAEIKKSDLPDKSTTPLASVQSPVYADDEAFATAVDKITAIVGKLNITTESDIIKQHTDTFFSTHHPSDPLVERPGVVVYPLSTEDVSQILKVAHEYRVPVVANSGLTSLEGHNMHTRGPNSISLAFGNLSEVVAFHPEDMDVVVQPGVGWQDLDDYLLSREDGKHLMFGPDPGMGATIAGMVGTSASGTNAYKYGTMKENVVNVTAVLADGTIVKTRQRPRKSSAGYDLTHLFIGSEGTLGVITEITVKLHPRPLKELVCIASFPTIRDAAATAQNIITKSGIHPNALELLNEDVMSFVNDSGAQDKKFLEKPTLLIKVGGSNEIIINNQLDIVKKIAEENKSVGFERSANDDENAILWTARRAGLWLTFEHGAKILKNKDDVQIWTTDFAVPVSHLADIIDETNADLDNSRFKGCFSVLGHVGDGNCHFLVLYNSEHYKEVKEYVDRMVDRAIRMEGTCTGEHGVGVGKRAYVENEVGTNAVDLMRHVKYALDPRAILNPDKVLKIDPMDNLDELLNSGHVHEVTKCC